MAGISIKVDYNALVKQANNIQLHGENFYKALQTVFNNVKDLHSVWIGYKYWDLVKEFNANVDIFNKFIGLVNEELPYVLLQVASNYSIADGNGKTKATKANSKKITPINIPDVEVAVMRFITNQVEEFQNAIASNFDIAKKEMNAIFTEYSSLVWISEASTDFKGRYKKLVTEITTAIDKFYNDFTNHINMVKSSMEQTEKKNTV